MSVFLRISQHSTSNREGVPSILWGYSWGSPKISVSLLSLRNDLQQQSDLHHQDRCNLGHQSNYKCREKMDHKNKSEGKKRIKKMLKKHFLTLILPEWRMGMGAKGGEIPKRKSPFQWIS